jgi:hypothetical protein
MLGESLLAAERTARSHSVKSDDQRAEHRLLKHADPHLDTAGDHRLDIDGGELAGEALPQRAEPAPDLIGVMEVKQDSADIDRVYHAGQVRLERHRGAEACRRFGRSVLGADHDTVSQRPAVAAKKLCGLFLGQPAALRRVGEKPGGQLLRPVWAQAAEVGYLALGGGPPHPVTRGVPEALPGPAAGSDDAPTPHNRVRRDGGLT